MISVWQKFMDLNIKSGIYRIELRDYLEDVPNIYTGLCIINDYNIGGKLPLIATINNNLSKIYVRIIRKQLYIRISDNIKLHNIRVIFNPIHSTKYKCLRNILDNIDS